MEQPATGRFDRAADPGVSEGDAQDLARRARPTLDEPGRYLVYADADGAPVAHRLTQEWTRVGRSLVADIRFEDATVSRRHALVVQAVDGVRVLDDGSLNGVFVNGERVAWQALGDGDEVLVGAHRLVFVEHVAGGPPPPAPRAGGQAPARL